MQIFSDKIKKPRNRKPRNGKPRNGKPRNGKPRKSRDYCNCFLFFTSSNEHEESKIHMYINISNQKYGDFFQNLI